MDTGKRGETRQDRVSNVNETTSIFPVFKPQTCVAIRMKRCSRGAKLPILCSPPATNFTWCTHQQLKLHWQLSTQPTKISNPRTCFPGEKRLGHLHELTSTLMILFLMRDCKNTHTSRTNRFCMYLSLMFSQLEMQFEM